MDGVLAWFAEADNVLGLVGTLIGAIGLVTAYFERTQRLRVEEILRLRSRANLLRANSSHDGTEHALQIYKESTKEAQPTTTGAADPRTSLMFGNR